MLDEFRYLFLSLSVFLEEKKNQNLVIYRIPLDLALVFFCSFFVGLWGEGFGLLDRGSKRTGSELPD